MISIKQKLELMEALESSNFEYERIPEFLQHASTPGLEKTVLKSIVFNLILLDTQISATYDFLEDEDWDSIFNTYNTPVSESASDVAKQVEILSLNFIKIYELIEKQPISTILEIFSKLFTNKTKNIQFLIFKLVKKYPREIFGYLLTNSKRDPRIFLPFYSSLLVRFKLEEQQKDKCLTALFKLASETKPSSSLDKLIIAQGLLYVLCFNPDRFKGDVKVTVDKFYNAGLFSHMNKSIVDRFCDLFNYKAPVNNVCSSNECLFLFPFDFPIIPTVQDFIKEDFIKFDS